MFEGLSWTLWLSHGGVGSPRSWESSCTSSLHFHPWTREDHAPCRPAASTVNWNTLYPCSSSSGNLEHPVVPASSQPACHSVLLLPHSSTACKMFLTNHENAKKFLNLIRFKLVMSVLSLIAIYWNIYLQNVEVDCSQVEFLEEIVLGMTTVRMNFGGWEKNVAWGFKAAIVFSIAGLLNG